MNVHRIFFLGVETAMGIQQNVARVIEEGIKVKMLFYNNSHEMQNNYSLTRS